jgi:hypothetical protein
VRRGPRVHLDWQVPQRMSANRILKDRFWEVREAAAGQYRPIAILNVGRVLSTLA